MHNADDNSALQRALQRSEPRRVGMILLVLAALVALAYFRHQAGGVGMQGQTFALRLALFAATVGYCLAVMGIVQRANARQSLLPAGFWIATTVIEACLPTAALFIVERSANLAPVQVLAGPELLFYGIAIVLSILRMRPPLCVLSGAVGALGFAALCFVDPVAARTTFAPGMWPFYLSFPVLLLLLGVAAALVCAEVRKYFRASLLEAEARRRLDVLHSEIEIARTIQQSLLPAAPPAVPGFDIAGWTQPADRTGSDYYDWQMLGSGRVAVVIADVSGHGIGPALLMAVCRAYARAIVPVGPELGAALKRINHFVHGDVREGRFVTCAVTIVDPNAGGCELLSAGHGPILHYRARDGHVEQLGGAGAPLGVLEDEDYGCPQFLPMAPGDVLLLVTDGFYEWARPGDGELFGLQRLRASLTRHSALDAATLIERLAAEVRSFGAQTPQKDDMTAVVVRCV